MMECLFVYELIKQALSFKRLASVSNLCLHEICIKTAGTRSLTFEMLGIKQTKLKTDTFNVNIYKR